MNKYFRKKATITTYNNDKYQIESAKYFVVSKNINKRRFKHKFGNAYTITKLNSDPVDPFKIDDVSFITEVFGIDEDRRFRFLKEDVKNPKITYGELHDNGKEEPITIIEDYSDRIKSIASIGDIVMFESDIPEKSFKMDIKVLRLIRKLTEKSNKKDL